MHSLGNHLVHAIAAAEPCDAPPDVIRWRDGHQLAETLAREIQPVPAVTAVHLPRSAAPRRAQTADL